MTKITLLLKLFVYLLVFKFVFTLNAIYYYYYYHYTLFIVCAHFRLMFGFCCVAVSLLFRVAPSSVRLFLPVHPYMCCADFSCTSTHPPAERSPSFTFFLISFSSVCPDEGTVQVIGPLEAEFCDLTSSFVSSFQPHGRVSGGF